MSSGVSYRLGKPANPLGLTGQAAPLLVLQGEGDPARMTMPPWRSDSFTVRG